MADGPEQCKALVGAVSGGGPFRGDDHDRLRSEVRLSATTWYLRTLCRATALIFRYLDGDRSS
jgi:hypothetical protein